jgi:hypothetical protein
MAELLQRCDEAPSLNGLGAAIDVIVAEIVIDGAVRP